MYAFTDRLHTDHIPPNKVLERRNNVFPKPDKVISRVYVKVNKAHIEVYNPDYPQLNPNIIFFLDGNKLVPGLIYIYGVYFRSITLYCFTFNQSEYK
jgi:hypothetical protein